MSKVPTTVLLSGENTSVQVVQLGKVPMLKTVAVRGRVAFQLALYSCPEKFVCT